MFLETLFSIVPQIDFIIFVSTFAGSLAGEFNKETTNNTPCSFPKFISQLLSSWMTSFATILFIHSTFNINDYNILISTSIIPLSILIVCSLFKTFLLINSSNLLSMFSSSIISKP